MKYLDEIPEVLEALEIAGDYAAAAGASGAIFGLLGAAIVVLFRYKDSFRPGARSLYVFNFTFIAVLNLVLGSVEPGIDNFAHLGGFLGGMLTAFVVAPVPRTTSRRLRLLTAALLPLLLIVAVSGLFAVRNAVGLGTLPAMTPYEDRALGMKFELPVFWEDASEGDGSRRFDHPFGARISIMREPKVDGFALPGAIDMLLDVWELRPSSDEQVPAAVRVKYGGRLYWRTKVPMQAVDGEAQLELLATETDKHIYIILLYCSKADIEYYREMFDALLAGLEVIEIQNDE